MDKRADLRDWFLIKLNMGFDLTVRLNVGIDPEIGIAFVWDMKTNTRMPFTPCEYIVPENFRKYLVQRGSHFHSYIKPYDETLISVERFFDDYPDWQQIKDEIGTDWKKEDHDGFKQALTWMNTGKNNGVFSISWSY